MIADGLYLARIIARKDGVNQVGEGDVAVKNGRAILVLEWEKHPSLANEIPRKYINLDAEFLEPNPRASARVLFLYQKPIDLDAAPVNELMIEFLKPTQENRGQEF